MYFFVINIFISIGFLDDGILSLEFAKVASHIFFAFYLFY